MTTTQKHPLDEYIRPGRLPFIWCQGCGLGIVANSFIYAIKDSGTPWDKTVVVSGIGCTGRMAGYLNLDGYHTPHGRALPFATGVKLSNPDMNVFVISGDGDLFAIGGNHFIHAARRNVDLKVICVNNLNYGMTGGQMAPTTPIDARTTTTPAGNLETPFNLPFLARASGAVYVARWTALHVRQIKRSIQEMLEKPGFSFLEIISPCTTGYCALNKLGSGLDVMKFYHRHSIVKNNADPAEAYIGLNSPITVGKFVDIERPAFEVRTRIPKDEIPTAYQILRGVPWCHLGE